MTRPARRPSALASSSPFDQPATADARQEAAAAAPAPVVPPQSSQAPTAPQRAAEKPEQRAAKAKPKKLTIYQDEDDSARMRGAMVATIPHEGFTTLSKFAQEAIMEKVERLEQKYNGGQPFPAVGPGVIPVGRPMGE
ncbi:ParB family protein [Microbacterium enclense]|uniref:ParB-like C-terminal domain-containing protein n=1 Tax=Microbacterium enclense TaxID=993073 RepID=A0A1G6RD52_9MICO|nr:hypothetical protein [Microbacterium enclense]KSU51570.1 hypothetical protein AS029_16115 [Microbacterium enclense]SDD02572.1 hypothetical protein SAMN05216418_0095 [Microbacterium enclense]